MSIQSEIQAYITDLQSQNYDVQTLKETSLQRCPPCETAQQNLSDIKGCKSAISKNLKQGWDTYKSNTRMEPASHRIILFVFF